MRRIPAGYLIRRIAMFFLTIWLSATIIFLIPHLAPGDPTAAMISRLSAQQGFVEGSDQIIAAWRARFGLDASLTEQYLRYLGNILTFNFGYSLSQFPTEVQDMVGSAIPWTIGLLSMATIMSFLLGSLIGALMAWRGTPRLLKLLLPLTLTFTSIPFYILGILLIYLLAFGAGWFPISGAYDLSLQSGLNWEFIKSVIEHGTLPALSIVISSMGFWALGMRGMMVTVAGEDYLTLARAKGLHPLRILFRYEIRNAILPQITSLALSLGSIVGGTVLVEYIFGYPGMGYLLYQGIVTSDYTVIQGVVFILIATSALAVLIIDLLYPLLDPRISYDKR
jgi:peptide/nickel transport system permease protein